MTPYDKQTNVINRRVVCPFEGADAPGRLLLFSFSNLVTTMAAILFHTQTYLKPMNVMDRYDASYMFAQTQTDTDPLQHAAVFPYDDTRDGIAISCRALTVNRSAILPQTTFTTRLLTPIVQGCPLQLGADRIQFFPQPDSWDVPRLTLTIERTTVYGPIMLVFPSIPEAIFLEPKRLTMSFVGYGRMNVAGRDHSLLHSLTEIILFINIPADRVYTTVSSEVGDIIAPISGNVIQGLVDAESVSDCFSFCCSHEALLQRYRACSKDKPKQLCFSRIYKLPNKK